MNATVDDFINAFTLTEAIQLSNLDDPTATEVQIDRIESAIVYAEAFLESYRMRLSARAIPAIDALSKRIVLTIARYNLDTIRKRDDVRKDYSDALAYLDKLVSDQPIQRRGLEDTIDYVAAERMYHGHIRFPKYRRFY